MRVAEAIETDAKTERELRTLSKGRRVEARVQQRASVILLAVQGWQNKDIADEVKLDRRQVALWRRRFMEGGLQALLQDAARSGRTPSVTLAVESLILNRTLHEQPAAGVRWSARRLASDLGLSATTIRRVWQRNGITPHLPHTAEASTARPAAEHTWIDVVGLYMHPRARALVLSCAENGPDQTLARVSTTTRDRQRLRMTALWAALDAMDGAVTSRRQGRYRPEEWLRFLRLIDRQTPRHVPLHLIVDDQAMHQRPEVQAWLARHARVVVHPTPARVSWLNTVKRFFRDAARQGIGRESFGSVAALEQAMAQHEQLHPAPHAFIWTVGD